MKDSKCLSFPCPFSSGLIDFGRHSDYCRIPYPAVQRTLGPGFVAGLVLPDGILVSAGPVVSAPEVAPAGVAVVGRELVADAPVAVPEAALADVPGAGPVVAAPEAALADVPGAGPVVAAPEAVPPGVQLVVGPEPVNERPLLVAAPKLHASAAPAAVRPWAEPAPLPCRRYSLHGQHCCESLTCPRRWNESGSIRHCSQPYYTRTVPPASDRRRSHCPHNHTHN